MANTEDVRYGKKDKDCPIRSETPKDRRETSHGLRSTTMALSASTHQRWGNGEAPALAACKAQHKLIVEMTT